MKKFFGIIILFISLIIVGCTPTNDAVVYESTPDVIHYKYKGCPTKSMSVIRFEYKGHSYIMFGDYHIVHDPDCSCHSVREDMFNY